MDIKLNSMSIHNLSGTEAALIAISESIKKQLDAVEKMVCTDETKQAAKKLRAELNRQFKIYDDERKERVRAYEEPRKKFDELFKKYIQEPYKNADEILAEKIQKVEKTQKDEKLEEVKNYAEELKTDYALGWLDIDRIIPTITLSASLRSLKAAVKEKLDKIKSDIDCIGVIDSSGEMFAEYMNCLDIAAAKTTVEKRKKAVEEAEKAKAAYSQNEGTNRQAEQKVEMLAPPTVEEEKPEEKKYTMTFTVSGTMEQLKALKAFMIENNIDFKNGGNNNE